MRNGVWQITDPKESMELAEIGDLPHQLMES